jgi:LuxR family maltose regulon positive regulatory protein
MEMLLDWRDLGLIRIVARAGYGKTTLAGMLLHTLAALPAEERPAAVWVSLDVNDGGRDAFLRRMDDALRPHFPELGEIFALERSNQCRIPQLVEACVRAFAAHPVPVVLVIDDCHLLDDDARAALQAFLDGAPDALHLLLLSRTPLALRISRRLLDRRVLHLGEDDLRLDHEEFDRALSASGLAMLSPAQRAEVERRTEGWILGLQMMAASPHARSGALFPPSRNMMLDDFFDAEIFAPLPDHVRRFLLAVAVLPFITRELAAAALDRPADECDALLQEIAVSNVFVTSFAGNSTASGEAASIGHRLHPLLREHLLRQPGAGDDDVRRRAAAWLAEHGEVDAALNLLLPHLVAAAADIVAVAGRRAVLQHEQADAQRWMKRLPEAAIAASPRLALDAAWLCLFSDGGDLHVHVARAQAAIAAAGDVADELRGDAAVLDAWRLLLEGRPDAARAATLEAARLLGDAPSIPAAYVQILNALTVPDDADVSVRAAALQRSIDIFLQVGYAHGAVIANSFLGTLKTRYCDPVGALASFEYAIGILTNMHFGRSSLAAEVCVWRAEILLFMGRLDEARKEFVHASEFMQGVDYYPRVYAQLCDLYQHGAAAIDDVADSAAWAAIVAALNPVMLSIVGMARILRDYGLGRPERCWQTVESIGILPHQITSDTPHAITLAVLAGAVLGGRSSPEITDVLARMRVEMQKTHDYWIDLRLHVLQVIDLVKRDDIAAASAHMQELSSRVEAVHMPLLISPCRELCALTQQQRQQSVTAASHFGLSIQELRVLVLLAAGRSTDEMAAELFVSRETLRTHLRRCFRKLDVHNRMDAVHVARQWNLVH